MTPLEQLTSAINKRPIFDEDTLKTAFTPFINNLHADTKAFTTLIDLIQESPSIDFDNLMTDAGYDATDFADANAIFKNISDYLEDRKAYHDRNLGYLHDILSRDALGLIMRKNLNLYGPPKSQSYIAWNLDYIKDDDSSARDHIRVRILNGRIYKTFIITCDTLGYAYRLYDILHDLEETIAVEPVDFTKLPPNDIYAEAIYKNMETLVNKNTDISDLWALYDKTFNPQPFSKRIHNIYAEQATIANDFKAYVKNLDFANDEVASFFDLAFEIDDFTVIQYLSRLLDRNIHKIAVGDLKSTTYPTPSCRSSSEWVYEVNVNNDYTINLNIKFDDGDRIVSIETSTYPC